MGIINFLRYQFNLIKHRRMWRLQNTHNMTLLENLCPIELVKVGRYSYGSFTVKSFNNISHLSIGNFCSIAGEVTFLLNAEHDISTISTYPFKVMVMGQKAEACTKGDIIVDDDVWIGERATIMSGVHIGQGAVIAAGSVVTHDIPPYAVVGGVPAKIIKYRFSKEIINGLLKVDYSKLTKERISTHIDELYSKLSDVKQLAWLPQKTMAKQSNCVRSQNLTGTD